MKILKKIIGFILLASVLGGLLVMTCVAYGTAEALLAWGIALLCTVIIVGGVHLLLD